MIELKGFLVAILVTFVIDQGLSNCPDSNALKPCTCYSYNETESFVAGSHLTCDGVTGAQLKQIFDKLEHLSDGEKHFPLIEIKGQNLDQLLEKTFDDITIDHILISDAPNLKKIHTNAFQNTHRVIESLFLHDLPELDVSNLFEIISKLRSLENLELRNLGKLEEIPSEAFKTLIKFHSLIINSTYIKKINEKAFWNLNSLGVLEITNTNLEKIGENIFVFKKESSHNLRISIFGNPKINCLSFSPGTFTHAGRPVSIEFSGYHVSPDHPDMKHITCLPEEVFKPFLEANEYNDIDMYDIDFDCTNCKNAWVKKATKYHDRILGIRCAPFNGGKEITDPDNFKGC